MATTAKAAKAKTEQWLFTFGFGHVHPTTGESLANRCVRFKGTYAQARGEMVRRFGIKWAFQYACDETLGRDYRELGPEDLPEPVERDNSGEPVLGSLPESRWQGS
jgi:hypothetical protein